MVTLKTGLNSRNSIATQSLGGPGPIAFEANQVAETLDQRRNDVYDYIRLRLGDGIVDVELDQAHFELGLKQALLKYRQKASNSQEESYAFLELLPETQEYILPQEVMMVRQVFRRGIGSVTGTTASQFEPFASGYLNTYMLVAGRVGGLANYEMFTQYQELAMRMFGGHINFTWNSATKKLTIVRKIPDTGKKFIRLSSIVASGTAVGSTITLTTHDVWTVAVGNSLVINNCPVGGYNGNYQIQAVDTANRTITILAATTLQDTTVTGFDLSRTQVSSPVTDDPAESVMLHLYNYKPDIMLLNDHLVFQWVQEYAYAFCKHILGEARSKFGTLAGPQGGTTLNGTALIAEAREEMKQLEEDLKNLVDGSMPLTWVIG